MHDKPKANRTNFCGRTRREFLWQAGGGFTGVALASMLGDDGFLRQQSVAADGVTAFANPLAPKKPHYAAKAKNVIFLFMYGGPSHIDTFDYKPAMKGMDNKTVNVKTFGRGGHRNKGRIVEPRWSFKQYGKCGQWVSELFPHFAECVDDVAFIHSMTADSPIHGSAMLMMNSGSILSGQPCLGSWANYGLGTINQDLPGFVVMLDPRGGPISGAKNWTSGYMPADYQATVMRSKGSPILDLAPPPGMGDKVQRDLLDTPASVQRGTRAAAHRQLESRRQDRQLRTRIPDAKHGAGSRRPEQGIGGNELPLRRWRKEDGRLRPAVLLARRLVERGVRFVQIYSGGNHNDANWDAHGDLVHNHNLHAGETDKPIAGLLKDLKRRGMLDETLVVWGGEFGRQPTAEYAKGTGRDHNAYGFTMWMAGGGIKGGVSVGKTDELGSAAIEDRMHVRRLHATILHQMGTPIVSATSTADSTANWSESRAPSPSTRSSLERRAMDLQLQDKVALVTGGSKGIGEAIVRSFMAEGARVANVNRSTTEGEAMEAEYASIGKECRFIQGDLCELEACKRTIETTIEHFGRIDILVNNAGVNDGVGLADGPQAFIESLQKNLVHVYALAHYALDELRKQQGVIINIGSKVSVTGQGSTSGYAAAKGGINGLTREWAVDLAKDNVRVNAVIPAEVWTPLYENWLNTMPDPAAARKSIEQMIPLGRRFTTKEELADMVVFLASPRSSHTTGQIVFVDGGYTHFDRKYTG